MGDKKSFFLSALGLSILTLSLAFAPGGAEAGLAIRIFGGPGYQNIGDLNHGLKGLSDSYAYYGAGIGYSAAGTYDPIHTEMNLGGDIIFQFSPNIGIGFGSGFLRVARTSELKLTAPTPALHDEVLKFTPEVTVIPIRAGLFFFLPLGSWLQISLNAGGEYYLASISSVVLDDNPGWWWGERDDKATGRGFGFHGGLGLEIRLSSALSLILEGQGRWAKVKDLTGSHSYRNSFGFEETKDGTLYYWTDIWLFQPFPSVGVRESLPSDPWELNARKAVLDLSGWSAVAGFLFRF